MFTLGATPSRNRLGFHYFPDTLHYREKDLQTWLPILKQLGASWLTLIAPLERAISEAFLTGLLESNIEPVLHFPLLPEPSYNLAELKVLFNTYARWGVRYIALFDQPNKRQVWRGGFWVQTELVERFLDVFIPLAECLLFEGLTPIFPPLEPGGDYWDLAFLRNALKSLSRRGRNRLLERLVLGGYAWAGNRRLDWGAGGIDRWPGAQPYFTPPGVQDHRGFRIFDWYLDIAQQELNQTMPIILLRAGSCLGDQTDPKQPAIDEITHAQRNMQIAAAMVAENEKGGETAKVPEEVLACNFWLLAAEPPSHWVHQAWFQGEARELAVVSQMRRWIASRQQTLANIDPPEEIAPHGTEEVLSSLSSPPNLPALEGEQLHSIDHYILLPLYGWGVSEWDLKLIEPMLQSAHPTVGFSLTEARLARHVTIVGGPDVFPEQVLSMLRESGCTVERILEDGTLVATS